MKAKEKGAILDAEAEAFLADVEYKAPHAAAAFMANLTGTSTGEGTNNDTDFHSRKDTVIVVDLSNVPVNLPTGIKSVPNASKSKSKSDKKIYKNLPARSVKRRMGSGLVPTPTTPNVPPTEKQLSKLFQPLYDEDEEFPPKVQPQLVYVAPPRAPEIAPNLPLMTRVTEDAPTTTTITSPLPSSPPDTSVDELENIITTPGSDSFRNSVTYEFDSEASSSGTVNVYTTYLNNPPLEHAQKSVLGSPLENCTGDINRPESGTSVLEDLKGLSWKTCQEGSLLISIDSRCNIRTVWRKQRKETEVPQDETHHDDSVPIPSNDPLLSGEDRMQLTELMILCTNLQKQVLDLEKAKDAQAKEIVGLKKRVQKVDSSEDKDSLGAQEDASKQGRSFEDIDKDAEVSLVDETQGRSADAEMFDTDDLHGDEVIVDMAVGEKQGQSAKVDEREVSTGVEDSATPTILVTTAGEGC
ncbi:hypothetical protein Tco_0624765 [Tanacetum coccineum]|uniref:Uncharacterized protein n=1 Tax=Tanacetum coccineum TaxID=301880 RepID=A0ABQ4WEX9_9ASTR